MEEKEQYLDCKGNGALIWGDDGLALASCLFDGLEDNPCPTIFLVVVAFLFAIWEFLSKLFKNKRNSKPQLWRELVEKKS